MPPLDPVPFWFLRHGETDWNARRLTQGNVEVPLNAAGRAQAREAAARLRGRGIARIVCSDLGRAVETAEIVGGVLGLAFTTDAALREARFGDQEGREMGEWYTRWVTGDYTPEGGEVFADLCARVVPAVNRALAGAGTVLIAAHGGMFRAIRAAMGLSPAVRTENGVPLECVPGVPAWQLVEH